MQYICSKTGDEGSIHATRKGMRAYNNNNMCGPSLHLFYCEVTHVIIVACPHPLSCCIYTALVSLLFGTVIPTSFNILMEMFLPPCICMYCILLYCGKYNYVYISYIVHKHNYMYIFLHMQLIPSWKWHVKGGQWSVSQFDLGRGPLCFLEMLLAPC